MFILSKSLYPSCAGGANLVETILSDSSIDCECRLKVRHPTFRAPRARALVEPPAAANHAVRSAASQRACARPFAMLARHWHGAGSRRRDALVTGLHYGASCVGCCAPMIVLMFVVGMNDLAWLLGLALLMALQKHAAWGACIALPAAAALAAAGVAIGAGWWVVPLHTLCGA